MRSERWVVAELVVQRPRGLVVGVTAVAVVAIDWLTKLVAVALLEGGRAVGVGSVMTLRLSRNSGVAFGLGDQLPAAVVIALTALVTVVLAAAAVRGALQPSAAAGLAVGGAVANLGDRLLGGSVTDFLDLSWWPSFNLADVAITVGVVLMLLATAAVPKPEGGEAAR